jgi:4-aminobutyrate aminotransferase/(S)-3-amino-2-methylpropionate transaminase
MTGTELPSLVTPVPGPASRAAVDVLARHECPAITARRERRARALGADHDDPIVWREAVGANVWDVDGNRYVDLTSGFGVALLGHRHPDVVAAVTAQSARLLHAMGDAFPDAARIALLERLGALSAPLSVALLGLSGSDAVDAAMKTAVLATGRAGVLAFGGAYHGLATGVLGLQAYRPDFTEPFRRIVHPDVRWLPYGAEPSAVRDALAGREVGMVLVEPVLGRGGTREPPPGWLAMLRAEATRAGAVLAFDEVLTGCGRTGAVWAGGDVVPDLRCVGKALAGGMPLSACLGTPEVMDAWGRSTGEALHTQTFLGHPVGCAAALAVLEHVATDLPARVTERGAAVASRLTSAGFGVRGRGLMLAVELGGDALAASRALLRRGFLTLPADGTSLQLTPPVTLSDDQLGAFVDALGAAR